MVEHARILCLLCGLTLVGGVARPVEAIQKGDEPQLRAARGTRTRLPLTQVLPPSGRSLRGLRARTLADGSVSAVGLLRGTGWGAGLHRALSSRDGGAAQQMRIRAAERAAIAYVLGQSGGLLSDADLWARRVEPAGDDVVVHLEQRVGQLPIVGTYATVLVGRDGVRFANHRLVGPPVLPDTAVAPEDWATGAAVTHALYSVRDARARGDATLVVVFDDDGSAALAWQVDVETEHPFGAQRIWVHADTLRVLGEDKLSRDAVDGVVRFKAEPVCQGRGEQRVDMPHVRWNTGQYTADSGAFYDDSDLRSATVALDSPYFKLINHGSGGIAGPWSFDLAPQPSTNDLVVDDAPLEQVDPFYHAHRVRGWLRGRVDDDNAQKRWTEQQVDVHINIDSGCNAYYDGNINFFRAAGGCINTGRVALIVYHEYGHGVHDHSGNNFDGQVSEGIGDFMGATILNSPKIYGIPDCGSEFRTCSNNYTYCRSGCRYGPGSEVHDAGQVMCAVWWELRQQLVQRYGYDLGVATTDRIFLKFLTLVGNMNSAYDAAIAADDDDDGDASNGTKHSCEINKSFANDEPGATAHFPDLVGTVPSQPSVRISHTPPGSLQPKAALGDVTLELTVEIDPGCAPEQELSDVTFHYQPVDGEAVSMPLSAPVRRADDGDVYAGVIPQVRGPAAFSYYFTAKLGDAEFVYPFQGNRAPRDRKWPYYRQMVYVGDQETLYFSDFERDDGGLVATTTASDGRSDWEWGEPSGIGGDPSAAHSDAKMWGTDLGHSGDGLYDRGRTSSLELPVIDASAYDSVRLQYWRQLFSADVARVVVNGRTAYEQRAGAFFWRDPEFMFQDLDISALAAHEPEVRIRFVMQDAFATGFELGGWNIDDVRVIGTQGGGRSGDPSGGAVSNSVVEQMEVQGCAAGGAPDSACSLSMCLWAFVLLRRRRSTRAVRPQSLGVAAAVDWRWPHRPRTSSRLVFRR